MPYYGEGNVRTYVVTIFLCILLGIFLGRVKEFASLLNFTIELFSLKTVAILALVSALVYVNEKKAILENMVNRKARRALLVSVLLVFAFLLWGSFTH